MNPSHVADRYETTTGADRSDAPSRPVRPQFEEAEAALMDYISAYARDNPGSAALWCLGVGFVLGWKLKPW